MDQTIHLVPLVCLQCSTPIPAEVHETAWVCAQCGLGMALHSIQGLQAISVQYLNTTPKDGDGKPYWVADGKVTLERQSYGSKSGTAADAQSFWSAPRRFFIPAFLVDTETLLQTGVSLLVNPPALVAGPAVPFKAVTLAIEDIQPVAEFIIMAVEAGRKDALKTVTFNLSLGAPTLWVLP